MDGLRMLAIIEAITDLGIKVCDENGNSRDPMDILKDLSVLWDMISKDKQDELKELFTEK